MIQFSIKCHKVGTEYSNPHFFILNKGNNAGKPLEQPCPNCFIVEVLNPEYLKSMYNQAEFMYQSRYWEQFLIGSVIPFLRLPDFKKEFFPKSKALMAEHEEHVKHVEALKILEQKENQFHQNINLINDMRRVILYRYCNK